MTETRVQVFKTARRLLTGYGASAQLAAEAEDLMMKRPLIVTDKGVLGSGVIEPILERFKHDFADSTSLYSDISAEPETHVVEDCCHIFTANKCDGIIAIGGGSAMDTAKAVAVYIGDDRKLEALFGEDQVRTRETPLICLPTTAGTGSEVTNIAILSDVNAQLKKGIVSNQLLPDVAIVAPELTVSCPPAVTAASGVDALVHAVESYLSNFSTELTRPLSLRAMTMINKSLLHAYENPKDMKAREQMATASLMAGLAFGNAGVGAVHALAYPLGGRFHLSHGVSNAVMFTEVMRWNYSYCRSLFLDIAYALGAPQTLIEEEAGDFVVERLTQLCEQVNIPKTLREFDIPKEVIPELAESAHGVTRLLRNNPRELSVEDIAAIYTAVY